jgi:hypothetical protein
VSGEYDDLWGRTWPLGRWPHPATLLAAVRRGVARSTRGRG